MSRKDPGLIAVLALIGFVLLGTTGFAIMANTPGGATIKSQRDLWDFWCYKATYTAASNIVADDPAGNKFDSSHPYAGQKAKIVTLSRFAESAQMQDVASGVILCDDGTRISAMDGHKL